MLLKNKDLSLDSKIWEFDFWITPWIVDIRSTDRFHLEMQRIVSVLDTLSNGDRGEFDETRYAADLVDRVMSHLDGYIEGEKKPSIQEHAQEFLASLSALLFLVTGKSDNNNKCQFPIYLKNEIGWETIPIPRTRKGKVYLAEVAIPRILDSESYMARIARIYAAARMDPTDTSLTGASARLLYQFASVLLEDEKSRRQLSAFIRHFRDARSNKEDPSLLLTPLVIFQVRGSVAASGGHEPEGILRQRMTEWGMIRGVDFNNTDVVLDVEAGTLNEIEGEDEAEVRGEEVASKKTRAYDFVLPYRTATWHPRIFVQSQFYAGDSGSVSHKNVDQTKSSRQSATQLSQGAWPESDPPLFLEYVDGAGYAASLNKDLKSLLSFQDTEDFFQIRSAPIRLRRVLQKIGFLTPLEIAHAVFRSNGDLEGATKILEGEGYKPGEIDRGIQIATELRLLVRGQSEIEVAADYVSIARRHLLLDLIACEGELFPSLEGVRGVALVPGYGPLHGLSLVDLDAHVREKHRGVWPDGFMLDLQELCTRGFVVLR